ATPSCHCARKLYVSALSERRLSWPRRRRAPPLRSGLLFHTVTVCPAFKRLAAIREPIAPRPRNPNFCSYLLLPPRVAHHVVLLCGSFRLHHSTATLPKCAPLAW